MSTLIYGLIPLGASSGAVAIDGAKGNAISLTLSGNVTLGATNLKVGTTYYALVTQASVGGPFQADASAFGGPADPISPSAGSVTLLAFLATSGSALKYIGATVETPAQTVHTADGALVIERINICTSAADGMTLPDATTNAGKSVIVINDMAATNVTITRAGSDTISGGSTSSTYVLPFGIGGVVTFIASAVSAKWYASPRLS
jgi:hypothetical protein